MRVKSRFLALTRGEKDKTLLRVKSMVLVLTRRKNDTTRYESKVTKEILRRFSLHCYRMESKLVSLPPFECENVPVNELRQKWTEYKNSYTYILNALPKKKKKNRIKLRDMFLVVAG